MDTTDLEKRLDIAKLCAQEASIILLKYFNSENKISQKETSFNIVTQADVESEKKIIEIIKKNFPNDHILAEESSNEIRLENHTWIIDPVDGTNNFAHGIAQFAISIAFYLKEEAQFGIVYNRISKELFSAVKGKGAQWSTNGLNTQKIEVSASKSLNTSIIGTGFYYDRGKMMKNTLSSLDELLSNNIHGIRRMGAASLDLCFTAAGRFDAYYEFKLAPWDFAAGAIILTEAGGTITDCQGAKLKCEFSSVLASNSKIQSELLNVVKKYKY